MFSIPALLCALIASATAIPSPPAIHYTLERRGGAFAPNWTANLTHLVRELAIAESRFNFTRREVKGNKVVRVPKDAAEGGGDSTRLIGEHGRYGNWFAHLTLGQPPQKVEMDIDMLTADFAVTSTSSEKGSKFLKDNSLSYKATFEIPFPNCGLPTDEIHLPLVNRSQPVSFAHCKPPLQSRDTLRPSGAIFGLAPSSSLSQLGEIKSFIDQLVSSEHIKYEVFSLTLINGAEGLLSVGGTVADAITRVESKIESFLGTHDPAPESNQVAHNAQQDAQDAANGADAALLGSQSGRSQGQLAKRQFGAPEEPHQEPERDKKAIVVPTYEKHTAQRGQGGRASHDQNPPTWREEWKWSPVQGAAGWWQTLMRGIWVDQVKIMKNQPIVIDINTPFILAPPLAAKTFYASISGSFRLPNPYSNFYAYPCNNPPFLHLEFGGWRFPVMRGTKSPYEHRGANGKFSLGKVADDSGYCVGAVVETRMGIGDGSPLKKASRTSNSQSGFGALEPGMLAGNGLRDVWILGEPAFRGVGLVFDLKTKEVGFRTY